MKFFIMPGLFFVRLLLICGATLICFKAAIKAQTTDLTKHIVGTVPAGYTLTWHTGTPATDQNQYAAPTMAPPGLYYAAYLDAHSNCYSQAVPVRYVAFQCGTQTADLRNYTNGLAPVGYQISYHSGFPASSFNELTPAQVAAAPVNSTYQVALKETTMGCYSFSRPIIVDGAPIPDYGNLPVDNDDVVWPAAYATIATNGPHTWLGISNDVPTTECATNISDQNTNGFQLPVALSAPGTTATFQATLSSDVPGTTVYYGIWIDWNSDGSFNDLDGNGNLSFYTGNTLIGNTTENVNIPISIPGNVSPTYKVRVISSISPITVSQSTGGTVNGEVEDYSGSLIILPMTFGAISATAKNCQIVVEFEYLSAGYQGQFAIEHFSAQDQKWQTVYSINAVNDIGQTVQYKHTAPANGVNLYRVKYIGKNGETIYSKTVSAAISCGANEKAVLYPNPLKSHLTVVLPATFSNGIIRISDAIGKPQIVKAIAAGSNIINTQILLPGVYIVEIIQQNKIAFTSKIIKQ